MEPITVALVTALASGINSVTNTAIKDAYTALKDKLCKMLPSNSDAVKALHSLEKKPDSTSRQAVLDEELSDSNIAQSDEIKNLLTALMDKLSHTEGGKKAMSKYNVKADKIGLVGDNAQIENLKF